MFKEYGVHLCLQGLFLMISLVATKIPSGDLKKTCLGVPIFNPAQIQRKCIFLARKTAAHWSMEPSHQSHNTATRVLHSQSGSGRKDTIHDNSDHGELIAMLHLANWLKV